MCRWRTGHFCWNFKCPYFLFTIFLICAIGVYFRNNSTSVFMFTGKAHLSSKMATDESRTRVGTNSDWMSNLPENVISHTKLYHLVIPGSHDSATFDLDPNGGKADDFSSYLDMPIDEVERWFKTQNLDFMEQLNLGIRYFDLRIIKHLDGSVRFVHGLYSKHPVIFYLKDIRKFLDLHPKEVLLLDFNHVYAMDKSDHVALCSEMEAIFEGILLSKQQCDAMATRPSQMTLQQLYDINGRVMILYKDARHCRNNDHIWTRNDMDILWPYTPNEDLVIKNLVSEFNGLYRKDLFVVWHGILTPHADDEYTSRMRKFKDLHEYVSKTTNAIVDWIKRGPDVPLNICCADFVEEHDFVKTVILSNYAKL